MTGARLRVVVVGLGAMGSAAAFHLARRGAHVTGLELFGPAHDQGSSHGESRIIRQAYFEGPGYVPLVMRAYQLWGELEAAGKEHLIERTGGIMIGPADGPVVSGSLASAERWDLPHRLLTATEVAEEFPALRPPPDQAGLFEPEAGVLAPELAVLAHLRQAAGHGAELHFGEPVLDWEPLGTGVSVRTAARTYQADRLVLAAGAWTSGIWNLPEVPLQVERQVMVWFAPAAIGPFTAPTCPIYLFEGRAGSYYYGIPTRDGRTAKAARHHGGEVTTAEDIRREVGESDLALVREGLAETVPELATAPVARSATCLYTNSLDHHFIVGLHPGFAQVAVAAGFSGHGFKFASAVGEALADLVEVGESPQPLGDFQPSRFMAHQSGGKGMLGSGGTPIPSAAMTSPIT
ncbi:MAG TPA: N-methyl-L-tryptophan oxidase [Candidatus Dormibacteraeota bacterium]